MSHTPTVVAEADEFDRSFLQLFPRRIDGQQDHFVREAQRCGKLRCKIPCPGIQMRLENGRDPASWENVAHRRERRGEFRRMVGIVVDVGQLRGMDMQFQTPFDAFEAADSCADGFRRDAVAKGDGRGGDGVLGIDPAGCSDFHLTDDAAAVVEVEDEAAECVRVGVGAVEIGGGVVVVISQDPGLRVLRRQVQPFLGDERAADLGGECLEGFDHMGLVAVDVQMVRVHGRDDGDFREELEEGAVEFVRFRDDGRRVTHQQVGPVVPGKPTEEGLISR